MKHCKKLLSVLLALALCGSMAAPAFAASFDDLDAAINDDFTEGAYQKPSGKEIDEKDKDPSINATQYGYGDQDKSGKWDIVAWDQDGDRNVKVNTDVTYDAEQDKVSSIYVGGGKDVNLDLGDYKITGAEGSSVFTVQGGNSALEDDDPTNTSAPGEFEYHWRHHYQCQRGPRKL